jgi:hypothetical protein
MFSSQSVQELEEGNARRSHELHGAPVVQIGTINGSRGIRQSQHRGGLLTPSNLLATYHDQHGGQINDLLRGPQVAATFSNWHS